MKNITLILSCIICISYSCEKRKINKTLENNILGIYQCNCIHESSSIASPYNTFTYFKEFEITKTRDEYDRKSFLIDGYIVPYFLLEDYFHSHTESPYINMTFSNDSLYYDTWSGGVSHNQSETRVCVKQ